jgi:UPF0716 protein FxsA
VPLLALILIFVAVPLAELYVIFKVGDAIGIPLTLAILVADSLLGSMLLKSQGRTVWMRFNEAVREGRIPHREIVDGVLIIFGGAFLITPGFITDVVGLLLLLPPTRRLFRGVFTKRLGARAAFAAGDAANERIRVRREPGSSSDYDVEGTASEREGEDPSFELPRRSGGQGSGRPQP